LAKLTREIKSGIRARGLRTVVVALGMVCLGIGMIVFVVESVAGSVCMGVGGIALLGGMSQYRFRDLRSKPQEAEKGRTNPGSEDAE
jgi:Flp pilus assembly protein TadB